MRYAYTNNYSVTLTADISAVDTVIPVSSAAELPAISGTIPMMMTLEVAGTDLREVIEVTSVDVPGLTLTVQRGQEGTQLRAFSTGDIVQGRLTSRILTDLQEDPLRGNETEQITVGYTTSLGTVIFTTSVTPDFTKPSLKMMTVTDTFTLEEPVGIGSCEFYLMVDSGGAYLMLEGTGVTVVDGIVGLEASTDYILNVRRFGAGKTVAQLVEIVP